MMPIVVTSCVTRLTDFQHWRKYIAWFNLIINIIWIKGRPRILSLRHFRKICLSLSLSVSLSLSLSPPPPCPRILPSPKSPHPHPHPMSKNSLSLRQYQHVLALCALLTGVILKGLFENLCLMFVYACFMFAKWLVFVDWLDRGLIYN